MSEETPIVPPSGSASVRSHEERAWYRGFLTFRRRWFPRWLIRDVVVPFAVSRVALTLVAWLGFHFLHFSFSSGKWEVGSDGNLQGISGQLSPAAHPFVNMWSRFDGGWYLTIAKAGYRVAPGEPSNVAFFPLYPSLIRALHYLVPLPRDAGWLLLGIAISNASLLAALVYLYQLARLDYERRTAARAVLYLCLFPTTLFLSAVYSESLFLAVAVSAFYYARAGRWLVAGFLAGAAALCRAPGVLLVLPLAFEYFSQKAFQWQKIRRDLLALALGPIALACHLAFLRWRFGDWNIMAKAQASKGWDRRFTAPWNTLLNSFASLHSYTRVTEFLFTMALLGLAIFACFRLRPSYAIYALVSLLFVTSWGSLTSVPRFAVVVFPVVMALALLGESKVFNRAYLLSSTVLAAIAMVIFSQWGWVA